MPEKATSWEYTLFYLLGLIHRGKNAPVNQYFIYYFGTNLGSIHVHEIFVINSSY